MQGSLQAACSILLPGQGCAIFLPRILNSSKGILLTIPNYRITIVGPLAHPVKEPNAGSWGQTHLKTHPLSTGGPSLKEKGRHSKHRHTANNHILAK
jgi:hypothetical protein